MLIEAKCCKTKSDQFENQNFTQNLAQKTETQKQKHSEKQWVKSIFKCTVYDWASQMVLSWESQITKCDKQYYNQY